MKIKVLVETLETPIKTTSSSSKGYKQRWTVLALKPSHLIHPNLNFSKSPPNQSSAQVPNTLASRRDAARGGRTPNPRRFVAKQGSQASPAHGPAECREAAHSPAERREATRVPGVVRPPPAREPAERREAACSPAERRAPLVCLPMS